MNTSATVAILGAGASGALTAAQLCRQAASDGVRLNILLVEPGEVGRGIAYSTGDSRHRVNVPAVGMSAWPDDPQHFVKWLRRHVDPAFPADGFAARCHYGVYLRDVLDTEAAAAPSVRLEVLQTRAADLRSHGRRWRLTTTDGTSRQCDAVLLALGGGPPSTSWAPPALLRSKRFVADPWAAAEVPARSAPDATVVLVGSGLTMADMAMVWGRAGTKLHTVSRHGLLPLAHRSDLPPRPDPPDIGTGELTLTGARRLFFTHVRHLSQQGGDWRSAVDSLRPVTAALWARLPESDQRRFLELTARRWNRARHRVEPSIGMWLDQRVADGSLTAHRATVVDAVDTADFIQLKLSNGESLAASHVVNCTGPSNEVARSADPLIMNLLTSGTALPGPFGMGLECEPDGRLISRGAARPTIWAIGPMRLGQLFETTAIPEIRVQAAAAAAALLAALPGPSVRRRPRDTYGLPLTASPAAASRYVDGLGRILRVQSGAEQLIASAVEVDPEFALGHATLALLGAEWGADVDVAAALAAAHRNVHRADERESTFIQAVTERVLTPGADAAATLINYVHSYPEDALALSISVPTIAFGGATELPTEAWALVENLAPAYGQDWWYGGMLAFVRQEQGRYDEAAWLADHALAVEPAAGHAVHARAHVYYETGDHATGLRWLDRWIETCGRDASHRVHFSWHAALHELALGDDAAAGRRYGSQLDPVSVHGVRALVDSASLLWRARMLGAAGPWSVEQIQAVLAVVPESLLREPPTPFVAMHACIALAAANDCQGLAGLRRFSEAQAHRAFSVTVAGLAGALIDLLHGDPDRAAQALASMGQLDCLGGSAAQREVIEDTLVYSALGAGRHELARGVLQRRLSRRSSARDHARIRALDSGSAPGSLGLSF